MGYILKNTSGLVNTRLTDTGRLKLSQGKFNISYFQIGDSEVSYNVLPTSTYNQYNSFVLEPSFNAQNSVGVPQSNKENIKYPFYVDGTTGNTYGIPFMDSIVSPVFNTAAPRGFFSGNTTADTISWSALTNNLYAINSNYLVQMSSLVGTNVIDFVYSGCNVTPVRPISVGDIITIYYDGTGVDDCICLNVPTPTPTPTPSSTPSILCECISLSGASEAVGGNFNILLTQSGFVNGKNSYIGTLYITDDLLLSYNNISNQWELSFNNIVRATLESTSDCPTGFTWIDEVEPTIFSTTSTICPTPIPNPCEITPTPTPSATCCITPTPSKPCPPVPEPDCLVSISSCYTILTYRVVDVCLNKITLDRQTPDFSYLGTSCYGRIIVYPPTLTSLYDSVTPMNHWSDNVINFESVCYTDEFDVKIWNMNILWSENLAGLNSATHKDYTQFGSINYLGSKEYFGYASSSGQTDTSSTYYYDSFDNKITLLPEEQKAIAIVHYTNQTVDLFYGEKFALEPFDETTDDTTGQARNFKVHLPWLMWHKNPECCYGQTFWVDPPGYENLNLFEDGPYYLKSNKNPDMNDPGIRYYHLWDTNTNGDGYPNRVGKVFPDSKIIIFDDEEIVAAMSYKSNRNWTLPAPQISLITPNTCGFDSATSVGILTANTEYLYVTYRFTNDSGYTNSLHCNYYQKIQGPNINCIPNTSQNVAVRFGAEFGCLSTAVIEPKPCWTSGFTLFVQTDEIGNEFNLFPFYSTNTIKNGLPIFYHLSNDGGLLNFSYNGTNWELAPFFTNTYQTTLSGQSPIGEFTFFPFFDPITAKTECYPSINLCGSLCVEIGPGVFNCITIYLDPKISGNTLFYETSIGDYSLIYNNNQWEWYSGNTIFAELTGLTSNDFPIGDWNIVDGGFDTMSTSADTNCYSATCECFNVSATSDNTIIRFIDCDYVINDSDVLSSGMTISGCVLTLDGQQGIFDVSGSTVDLPCATICNFPPVTSNTSCNFACNVPDGYLAERFEIICQKVSGDSRPESSEWKIIDFTNQLSAYTINGLLTQSALTATTFVITQDDYDSAPFYDLSDYINLTSNGSTLPQLNFGDEYYFYGNIETDIQATIYEMRYKINLSQIEFQTSSNPTWNNTLKPYVTEIGLFDSDKDLLIVSKLQSPILRQGIQQFLIKFDI